MLSFSYPYFKTGGAEAQWKTCLGHFREGQGERQAYEMERNLVQRPSEPTSNTFVVWLLSLLDFILEERLPISCYTLEEGKQ